MGNRIIKESICTSDTIDRLSWFEEVFFYRLIVNADDYGRFDGRPAVIKGRLFPLKDIRPSQIDDAINTLSSLGIVARYQANGQSYLRIVTWAKHQRVRQTRAKFPAPIEEVGGDLPQENKVCGNLRQTAADCSNSPPNPIQSKTDKTDGSLSLLSVLSTTTTTKPKQEVGSTTKFAETTVEVVEAHKAFESKIGPCVGNAFELLSALVEEFGLDKVLAAIDKAKASGGRTVKYVDSILHNRQSGGGKRVAKNDFEAGLAEATRILESGELDGIFG